ncbi:MAG TPA: transcription antitermination factor NusB [Terracidiphilus sp.]|jgi:16S rRNA (cytosine967-C5)-methyltransferase
MTSSQQFGPRKTAPKNRPAKISLARKAAFNALLAVERGHAHSDDLLRGKAVNTLSPQDRNLATALVLGVLRWQIRLDHQLQSLLTRPNAKLDAEVRVALRLGAFQILHMDRIPARAAIDESVELAKQAGYRFASAMVNAVLRKLAAPPQANLSEDSAAGLDLALAEAHPAWMVERWAGFYGLAAARAICRHGQTEPALVLRFDSPARESELSQAGVVVEHAQILASARMVVSGDVAATAVFQEGQVRIQDEGSQLVGEIAAANLLKNVGRVLDTCAAPGGKTLILAERNPKASIVACESSSPRLEQMRQRLATHAGCIECRLADATQLTEDAAFDLALADVPCSGTGTLGRNPEIRHRLRLEDMARQAERQHAILTGALRAIRPGGRVVYSTCSLEPEENEQVVAAVLAETANARQVSLHDSIESLRGQSVLAAAVAKRIQAAVTPEGALRLLPGAFNTDGFFVALIERTDDREGGSPNHPSAAQ